MSINREVFARVWFVSKFGYPDHRNAALARLSMLREALRTDRRFPSKQPVLPTVETECWTWWHQVSAESEMINA
jgi:hypothetical protein